jgi:hypothetical protein
MKKAAEVSLGGLPTNHALVRWVNRPSTYRTRAASVGAVRESKLAFSDRTNCGQTSADTLSPRRLAWMRALCRERSTRICEGELGHLIRQELFLSCFAIAVGG